MIETKYSLDINIYPPDSLATGAFDGGRITEIKPIPFPGERSYATNTGPLFYWAWAEAKGYGKIGLHPHRGFEIMSYALEGEIGHYDTLGTRSRVKAGGAQVMQTGSGVSHEEETIGEHTEFFQIWFDPNLREALNNAPTYREISPQEFPIESSNGITIKSVMGDTGPIAIKTEAVMKEISISSGQQFTWELERNFSLAIVTIDGKGTIIDDVNDRKFSIQKKYFSIVHAKDDRIVSFQADLGNDLKLAIIQVPNKVDYPLYPEQ